MGKRGPAPGGKVSALPPKLPERPAAPRGMTPRARAMWTFQVKSHDPKHFGPGDRPLLKAFCEAYDDICEAREALAEDGLFITAGTGAKKTHPAVDVIRRAESSMSMLATKLRICANSRITAKKAGHEKPEAAPTSGRKMFGAS